MIGTRADKALSSAQSVNPPSGSSPRPMSMMTGSGGCEGRQRLRPTVGRDLVIRRASASE